jgi:hypothetical protein
MSRNYINNKDLLAAMVQYLADLKEAEEAGREKPRIPEYIGMAIFKISEGLGKKGNFRDYSFLSEMKSDGIENCMQYLHNFNPEKSTNPFAYFTRIIWFAFIRRIQKEKKQQYIKYKLSMQSMCDPSVTSDHTMEMHQKMAEMAEKFEKANNIKKPKKKGVEKFTEE